MVRSKSDTGSEDETQETTRQVCPDCGHSGFSWFVKRVAFGSIDATDAGLDYQIRKNGHAEGADDDSVMCQDCHVKHQPEDLIGAHEWAAREEEKE